jgi:ketosteroid isomerase-like protein
MSQENVDKARDLAEAFSEGDVDRFLTGLDPEIEVDLSRRLIDPETYRGHEGVREYLRKQRDVWRSQRIESEEYIAVGENVVVVPIRFVSTGRGSEIDVRARAAWVWEFREGLGVRATAYQSKQDALEAVGLRE